MKRQLMPWSPYIISYLLKNKISFEMTKQYAETPDFEDEEDLTEEEIQERWNELSPNYNPLYYDADVFTLHYPTLLISNESQKSFLLRDVYIRFSSFDFSLGGYTLMRGTKTELEHVNGYNHSHVPSRKSNAPFFDFFCIGNSNLVDFTEDNYYYPNEENTLLFFILLNDLIHTESKAGGPYAYFSHLSFLGLKIEDEYPSSMHVDRFRSGLPLKDSFIDFHVEHNRVVINRKWIKKQLTPNCYYSDGDYYDLSIDLLSPEELKKISGNILCNFKNKPVKYTIIPAEEEEIKKAKDRKKVVHPYSISTYHDKLQPALQTFILQKDGATRKVFNGNPQECLATNPVPHVKNINSGMEWSSVF